jgi:hypothetical protein
MRLRTGVSVCAVAAAALLSACGDGGDGGSDDPASLTPADVPVYLQADLRPDGQVKDATEDLVGTISGQSSGSQAVDTVIDQAIGAINASAGGEDISFDQDIDPWLGDTAGVFVTGIDTDSAHGAAIFQTSDEGAANDFVDKAAGDQPEEKRSYEGVDYRVDVDAAVGVVDGFFVIGDEPAFKEVVDVSQGGDALADDSDFSETIGRAPGGSLVDTYFGLDDVLEAIQQQADPSDRDDLKTFQGAIGDLTGKSVLASLVPASDSVELDLQTNADQGFEPADVSELIGSFPADSFVALAVPGVGERVKQTIDQLESAGVPGVSTGQIDQVLSAVGLSLDEITSNLRDLGLFVEGTDESSLEGALVLTVKDEKEAQSLVADLANLAVASGQPGISKVSGGTGFSVRNADLGPQPGVVLTAGDRIAIGYGEDATAQALTTNGKDTLAGDSTYSKATGALGGDVELSGYLSITPILQLAESLGAGSDSGYRTAKPYLQRFSYLVFGSGKDGDFATSKVVVGVQR